jgi:hypothetical protein
MRKLLNRKIVEQDRICAICHEEFTDYSDVVPDHRDPKGMGGAWRDDHPDNIQATHWWCNEEKGSTRIDRLTPISPLLFAAATDRHVARLLCAKAKQRNSFVGLRRRATARKHVGVAYRFC